MSAMPQSTNRGFCGRSRPRSPRPPREHPAATVTEHFLRRRHAVADAARDRRRHPRRHRQALDRRPERRSHARSQSDQRRGDALSRLSRGRRQPRVARRAGARRCGAERARPPAHRAGGARRRRGRARELRALLVRPDLRASAADAASNGGRARTRHRAKPPSTCRSIMLTIEPDTPFAALHAARQARDARRRHRARALRSDAGDLRERGPAGLRSVEPRPSRRRVPAQSRLLARPRIRRRRPWRARPARHRRHAATPP